MLADGQYSHLPEQALLSKDKYVQALNVNDTSGEEPEQEFWSFRSEIKQNKKIT